MAYNFAAEDRDFSYETCRQSDTWNQKNREDSQAQVANSIPIWPQHQALDELQPYDTLNCNDSLSQRPTSHPHTSYIGAPLSAPHVITGVGYCPTLNHQDPHGQQWWNPINGYGSMQYTPDLQSHHPSIHAAMQIHDWSCQLHPQPDSPLVAALARPATVPSTPYQKASGPPWDPLPSTSLDSQSTIHFRARTAGNDVLVTTKSSDARRDDGHNGHTSSHRSESGSGDLPHSRCKICNNVVSKAARESDRKSNVTRHIRNHHRGLAKPTCNEPGCDGKAFARQDLLLTHQRSNHGTMPPHRVSRRGSRASRGRRLPQRRTSY